VVKKWKIIGYSTIQMSIYYGRSILGYTLKKYKVKIIWKWTGGVLR
jgi:hypothetical protein